MGDKCQHDFVLDYQHEVSYLCNGDVCDRKNDEHHCGSYTKFVYWCKHCGKWEVDWHPEEPPA